MLANIDRIYFALLFSVVSCFIIYKVSKSYFHQIKVLRQLLNESVFIFLKLSRLKKSKSHADKALEHLRGLVKANCEIQYYYECSSLPCSFLLQLG